MNRQLNLRYWPNPALQIPAEPVTEFDRNLADIAAQMVELMCAADGSGLAAPQAGLLHRIFCFRTSLDARPLVVVNPWLENSGPSLIDDEGCLSLPGIVVPVARYQTSQVHYQTVEGEPASLRLHGHEARIVQHETDHLDGIMMFDPRRSGSFAQVMAIWNRAPEERIAHQELWIQKQRGRTSEKKPPAREGATGIASKEG